MGFVKLDCGMLDSSIWCDKDSRDLFITALLMAEPFEVEQPLKEIATRNLDETGWVLPAGWYGIVRAAGSGIVRRCGLEMKRGMAALERLASPDKDSRSSDHEGRRMIRVDGGFVVLNYDKYREKDYTAAERMRRWREKNRVTRNVNGVTRNAPSQGVTVTQAEAEAEAEANTVHTPSVHDATSDKKAAQNERWVRKLGDKLGELFHRKPGSHLSRVALEGLLELVRREDIKDELETICGWFSKRPVKPPQSLDGLIDGWDKCLDRARNHDARLAAESGPRPKNIADKELDRIQKGLSV